MRPPVNRHERRTPAGPDSELFNTIDLKPLGRDGGQDCAGSGPIHAIAAEAVGVLGTGGQIAPFSGRRPDLTLPEAYRVTDALPEASGERSVGRKIGFTNRTIWDEYGVHAPIWAPMYDSTVESTDTPSQPILCSLFGLVEPRIEPEIIFRIATPPTPDMVAADLLSCLDAVAHGFEIVQSLYPGWCFSAPDTVAAFALHGRLRHGPFVPLDADQDRAEWVSMLSRFEIELMRNGVAVDRGAAVNVLDGPLFALGHLVWGLDDDPLGRGLRAGDLVSTGTITRAFPVHPGETWTSQVIGLPVPGTTIAFF